jgi:hypothetical protein
VSTADVIALAGVIVATLALIVAFAAMIWQARQTHASSSVDNMWRFLDEWDTPQMQQVRAKACRSLKARGDGDDIADLLNFFEELGFLVHQGALDSNTAWAMFSDWALPYWRAAGYYVKVDQDRDPTYWENFEHLNKTLLDIEAARRKKSVAEVQPTDEDVEKLFEGEFTLDSATAQAVVPAPATGIVGTRTFSPWRRKRPVARTNK